MPPRVETKAFFFIFAKSQNLKNEQVFAKFCFAKIFVLGKFSGKVLVSAKVFAKICVFTKVFAKNFHLLESFCKNVCTKR
jgi:hypothetical protein